MRKPQLSEIAGLIIGVVLMVYGYFILSIPKTFDRVMILQQWFFKYGLVMAGIILIILSVYSLFYEVPLLQEKKKKTIALNVVVLGIAVLFCILVLEIFLEATASPGCKQGDPIYDHSYIPYCNSTFKTGEWNTKVLINSEGLRDDQIVEKEENELRILMLGDSFTWGYGVEKEETFSDLLEQKLIREGMNANVINAGATSYSPILEYLFLKNKGIHYRPDIVVLNFDLSDLQDDYLREKKAQFNERGELIAVYNPDKDGLVYHLRKRIQITNLINSLFVAADKILPPPTEIDQGIWGDIRYDRYGITRDTYLKNEEKQWERTFSYIKKISELSKQQGITFILSTYPYAHQISPTEWNEGRHNSGLQVGVVYSDRAETKIQRFAAENDILFVSMFAEFREAEQTKAPLYFPYDGHFNQQGHQVAAEALYTGLRTLGIIRMAEKEQPQGQEEGKIFILPTPFQQYNGK